MPKLVDHDKRREELADAALQIIAREGMRGVTTRAVADESGWSTGVLTHYFGTLNDLLLAALRRAADLQGQVFREHRSKVQLNALERLRLILESILPLDDRRVALTRIFSVYFAEVGVNPATREEVTTYLRNWRRLVERTIIAGQEDGSITTTRDPTDLTIDLVAFTDGISIHAAIDPQILNDLMAETDPSTRILREVLQLDSNANAQPRSRSIDQDATATTEMSRSHGEGLSGALVH